MDEKWDPAICCVQETHVKHTDADRLRVKGGGSINHVNTNVK